MPISATSGAKGWSAWWSSKLLHEQATSSPASTVKLSGRIPLIHHHFIQKGQGMVEYALILALVALIVLIALIATGGQLLNLYSHMTATMCNYHVGCGSRKQPPPHLWGGRECPPKGPPLS